MHLQVTERLGSARDCSDPEHRQKQCEQLLGRLHLHWSRTGCDYCAGSVRGNERPQGDHVYQSRWNPEWTLVRPSRDRHAALKVLTQVTGNGMLPHPEFNWTTYFNVTDYCGNLEAALDSTAMTQPTKPAMRLQTSCVHRIKCIGSPRTRSCRTSTTSIGV